MKKSGMNITSVKHSSELVIILPRVMLHIFRITLKLRDKIFYTINDQPNWKTKTINDI